MKKIVIILLIGFFLTGKSQQIISTPSLELTAKADTVHSVLLKWDMNASNVMGFVIEKKEGDHNWLIVGQADPHEQSFVDLNISPDMVSYRVRAFACGVFSAYSNEGHLKK